MMRIETLRSALGALRDEYSATVSNAVNAQRDAESLKRQLDDARAFLKEYEGGRQ